MKAAIAIDPWKLPIFARHLTCNGYAFKNCGYLQGALALTVETENMQALAIVVKAANDEAALTGKPT